MEIKQIMKQIELNIKDLKGKINLNEKNDDELLEQIKQIINILNNIDGQAKYMKEYIDKNKRKSGGKWKDEKNNRKIKKNH